MAKVSYAPDAQQIAEHALPDNTEQYGYSFVGGKAVEVTNPAHLAKFAGHPFFKVTDGAGTPSAGLEAVHRGRGVYGIMQDGAEVAGGLTKADADAFNALNDEDKAVYVWQTKADA